MNRYHWIAGLDAYIVIGAIDAYSRWVPGKPAWALAFAVASIVIFVPLLIRNIQKSKEQP